MPQHNEDQAWSEIKLFFSKKVMIRETQLLAPTSPSLTHRLSSETRLQIWSDEHTTALEEKMAWKDDKKGKEAKWSQPPQRFIPPPSGSLSWPLPSLPPKPWSHGAPRQIAGSRRPRRAYSNHKAQRTWALKTPLPSSFRRKRPPHLSHSHNSKVKAPWWMLENSGALFLSIQESCLDYTFIYNTSVIYNTSEQRKSFPKVCMSHTQLPFVSLHGKILWLSSRQSNVTVHIWNPGCLWKLLQESKKRSLPKMSLKDFYNFP